MPDWSNLLKNPLSKIQLMFFLRLSIEMDIPLFHYYPFDYLTPLQSSITELLKFLLTSFSHFSLFSHIVLPACGCGRRPALLRPEQPRPPRLQQQVPQSCPNRRGAMSAWPRLDIAGTAGSSGNSPSQFILHRPPSRIPEQKQTPNIFAQNCWPDPVSSV